MSESFFGIPAEVTRQIKEQHAHRQMHVTEEIHRIRDFLNGLDKEGLEVLSILLSSCSEPRNISFFIGRIVAIEESKFNECPCGVDHDKIPESMAETPESINQQHVAETLADDRDPEEVAEEAEETADEYEASFDVAAAEADIMAEYGIEEDPRYPVKTWDAVDGPAPQPFRCINCGQGYASVADRCLRPPMLDGCSGCQRKSATG